MDDDFNTGGAIGVLYELLKTLNRFADAQQRESRQPGAEALAAFRRGAMTLKELTQILGVFLEPSASPVAAATSAGAGRSELVTALEQLLSELGQSVENQADGEQLVPSLVQRFITLRAEARKAKNFARADQIRQRLAQLGVTLEDRPGGTDWRLN